MKTLLLGAGRSGLGAAQVLAQNHQVRLINEHPFQEMELLRSKGIEVLIQSFEEVDFSWADRVFKAPGIPFEKEGVHFYNEIELASEYAPDYHLYAITGSNGKTTTTTLTEKMLQKKDSKSFAAGNIGYALSQAILDKGNFPVSVALEISAFQLDGLDAVSFEYGAILNLSPDHLDRYDSKEAYYASKLKIFDYAKKVLINVDDAELFKYHDHPRALTLSLEKDADIYFVNDTLHILDEAKISFEKMLLEGKHNRYNAAFAASLAYFAGVEVSHIEKTLQTFTGVEHRLEYVGTVHDIHYYNDSKATNPESTLAALERFEKPVLLLAGGKDEGNDFSILTRKKDRVKKAYLFGESARKMASYFDDTEIFSDLESAFMKVELEMKPEDVVLLSPACASYDQYNNFEERGQAFKKLIKTR